MITKNVMVTIAGRPNVGKSTLTNALVGEKISIVSNKPQTTRNRIFAILNQDDTQIILTDTPGFHRAKNRLGDYMVKCVEESVADVDVIALVVEPIANVGVQEEQLIAKIKATRAPSVLVINKIDTVESPSCWKSLRHTPQSMSSMPLSPFPQERSRVSMNSSKNSASTPSKVLSCSPMTWSPTSPNVRFAQSSSVKSCCCACSTKFLTALLLKSLASPSVTATT